MLRLSWCYTVWLCGRCAAASGATVAAEPPHLLHCLYGDDGRLVQSQRIDVRQVGRHALLSPRTHWTVQIVRHSAHDSNWRQRSRRADGDRRWLPQQVQQCGQLRWRAEQRRSREGLEGSAGCLDISRWKRTTQRGLSTTSTLLGRVSGLQTRDWLMCALPLWLLPAAQPCVLCGECGTSRPLGRRLRRRRRTERRSSKIPKASTAASLNDSEPQLTVHATQLRIDSDRA